MRFCGRDGPIQRAQRARRGEVCLGAWAAGARLRTLLPGRTARPHCQAALQDGTARRHGDAALEPGNRASGPADWVQSYTAMARRLTPDKHGVNDDCPTSTRATSMSILGKIFGRIFPSFKSEDTPASAAPGATAADTTAATSSPAAVAAMAPVDVEALLSDMAEKSTQTLNWRTSIVDLMKLLGLDSSLVERKALATELGYTQDMNDSAAMNIWLHRQVMNKLAANGGKVPAELKD